MTGAARFTVRGHVQGVAFRAHARMQAIALGLRGHAFNRDDGSVDVLAVGAADAIDALARWLAQGPPLAQVRSVEREDIDAAMAGDPGDFRTG